MLVGVPKEIKTHEYRVGLTPSSVKELVRAGAEVVVEKNAGLGIGIDDQGYIDAGARIASTSDEIFASADLIVKVKEPQAEECLKLRENQTIFTYLHLAPDPYQAKLLKASGCTAIAYETVTQYDGGLPLLSPMSQVAGRMSIQAGAHCLEKANGGSGVLLGGVPGVEPGHVVIIGGGVVGTHAAEMALGLGASVTVLDKSLVRIQQLQAQFGARLNTIYATHESIEHYTLQADLVVGAVLIPGAAAPKLITKDMLIKMRPGSVIVDVAIDQGGCIETSRPTTHHEPTYTIDGIIHYCVANMPGAVPRTSTFALNNATLPFILSLVTKGVRKALCADKHFLNGLNVHQGKITCEPVAIAIGDQYVEPEIALAG
jgi:alanine dehydrogenase